MKENNNNQPQFGTATNTSKNAGLEGAEKLRQFMLDKFGKDPKDMSKAEKRAFRKMAKELKKAGQISEEEYDKILAALN